LSFLLDTHILVWLNLHPERISAKARALLEDQANLLMFSAISIYEVTIKANLERPDFRVDPTSFRDNLIENEFEELPFTSEHALAAHRLPLLHKDPFDRALVAQAISAQLTLLTADAKVAAYPGPIILV
jgi:PIN domain nuclease of toxin-antitoxin system